MISDQMFQALQNQVTVERTNEAVYLQLSVAMRQAKWRGFSHWFHCAAKEEDWHAWKFIRYLDEQERFPQLGPVVMAVAPGTPLQAFQAALTLEEQTTAKIKAIYDLADEEGDYATQEKLDWFVHEQKNSEQDLRQIIAEVARADQAYLKLLDKQLGKE